jgi:hypothetical protein
VDHDKKRGQKPPREQLFCLTFSIVTFRAFVGLVPPEPTHSQDGTSTPDSALPEITALSEPGRASVRVDATLKRKPLRQAIFPGVGESDFSSTGVPESSGNRVRKVPQKPVHTAMNSHVIPNLIVVKFVEGSGYGCVMAS